MGRRASVAETAARDYAAGRLLTESFFLSICDEEPWIAARASAANQGFQEENRDVSRRSITASRSSREEGTRKGTQGESTINILP